MRPKESFASESLLIVAGADKHWPQAWLQSCEFRTVSVDLMWSLRRKGKLDNFMWLSFSSSCHLRESVQSQHFVRDHWSMGAFLWKGSRCKWLLIWMYTVHTESVNRECVGIVKPRSGMLWTDFQRVSAALARLYATARRPNQSQHSLWANGLWIIRYPFGSCLAFLFTLFSKMGKSG